MKVSLSDFMKKNLRVICLVAILIIVILLTIVTFSDKKYSPSNIISLVKLFSWERATPYRIAAVIIDNVNEGQVCNEDESKCVAKRVADKDILKYNYETVRKFIKENSYDQRTLLLDVYGPIVVTGAPTCYGDEREALDVADDLVNYSKYDFIAFFSPYTNTMGGCLPRGTVGKVMFDTDDGKVSIGVATFPNNGSVRNDYLDVGLAHEHGHNMGAWHPRVLLCDGVTWRIDPEQSCQLSGDPIDIMSGGVGHMSPSLKELFGWFSKKQLITVKTDGVYSLSAYETNTKEIKAIKVPRGNDDSLYIHYRQGSGFDSVLAQNNPDISDGIFIQSITQGKDAPWLLLVSDPSSNQDDVRRALLKVGMSYKDVVSGVTVKLESIKNQHAKVRITGIK